MSAITTLSQVVLSNDLSRLDVLGEIDVNNEPLRMDQVLREYGPYNVLMSGSQALGWLNLVRKHQHPQAYFAVDTQDFTLSYVGQFRFDEQAHRHIQAGTDEVLKEGYWLIPMRLAEGWLQ